MNEQVATISHAKDTFIELAVRFGPRLFTALLILFIGFFVSSWVSRWFELFLKRRELETPLRLLLSRIAWVFCIALFALLAPNRKVVGEILHNYGRIRQVEVYIGVAYDSDLGAVIDLIRSALQANPRVLREPPPVVQPMQFGDSAVGIAVKPWVAVQDQVVASGEIHAAVLATLRARGVVIPAPQREVRLIGQPA